MILVKSTEEIKQAAFDWDYPVDNTQPIAERVLWYTLKEIYKRYNDHNIGKAEGERLVQDAMKQYRIDSTLVALQRMQIEHQAQMWKDIERAGSLFKTEHTLDYADSFYNAVYGFRPTGNES